MYTKKIYGPKNMLLWTRVETFWFLVIYPVSRGIEIDLKQNFSEDPDQIPKQFDVRSDTQM